MRTCRVCAGWLMCEPALLTASACDLLPHQGVALSRGASANLHTGGPRSSHLLLWALCCGMPAVSVRRCAAHLEGGDRDDDSEGGSALGLPWALPGSLQGHVIRPGIVHRLDKGTTGLLVVAKDDATLAGLAAQFKAHTVLPHPPPALNVHLLPVPGMPQQRWKLPMMRMRWRASGC